jgi:hypothetical protein
MRGFSLSSTKSLPRESTGADSRAGSGTGGPRRALSRPPFRKAVVVARPVEPSALEPKDLAGDRPRRPVPSGQPMSAAQPGKEMGNAKPDPGEERREEIRDHIPEESPHADPYPPAAGASLLFLSATRRRDTAAGVTPGILRACPIEDGRTRTSLSRTSADRP